MTLEDVSIGQRRGELIYFPDCMMAAGFKVGGLIYFLYYIIAGK